MENNHGLKLVLTSGVFVWLLNCAFASSLVTVFDDAVPGQDRKANRAVVVALESRGFKVETLDVAGMANLSRDRHAALVLPSCEAIPRPVAASALSFVQAGGPTVFTGGPMLDKEVFRRDGRWYTREMVEAELARTPIGFRPPCLYAGFNERAWHRVHNGRALEGSFFRREGDCFHLSTVPLMGWDVFHSPRGVRFFGDGETMFTFTAKADETNTVLSVEFVESDGSRWVATPPIGVDWTRVTLSRNDFRYWRDSSAKGRGGPGDHFNPERAIDIGLGFSQSHTPVMAGRAGSVWFRDFGSCRDPFAGAGAEPEVNVPEQDCVYPRYKTMRVSGELCAVPRPQGEGFGQGICWRFIPLRTVRAVDAVAQERDPPAECMGRANTGWPRSCAAEGGEGAAEWMLLERRPGKPARRLAGMAVAASCDPPAECTGRANTGGPRSCASAGERGAGVADMVARLVSESRLYCAGTDKFAYFPGEPIRVGADWYGPATSAEAEVCDAEGRVVWRGVLTNGVAVTCPAALRPSYASCRVSVRLGNDAIVHEFAVLPDGPDAPGDFITVKDGNFMLHGKPWYPVGVNFWPGYIAGMAHKDYWDGWMRGEAYSPALVERDLAHFAAMGGTMISIQAPAVKHVRNLLDVLRRCRAHGIYVNLYVGWASPLDFRDKEGAEFLAAGRLVGNATIIAYDTIWEPGNHLFKNDAARARWDAAWRQWIIDQYGSVARAERDWGVSARRNAKGEVIGPMDKWFVEDGPWRVQMAAYRRFMDNATSRAWNDATQRLRALDPNHLVSFRQGNTLPYDFALSGPVRHIDFICPEGYAVPDTDAGEAAIGWITRYVDATTGGKPIVWSEFGRNTWDARTMEASPAGIKKQGTYSARFYRAALRAGANGTVPWWWPGGYRVGEKSDYGIIAPSGEERPAARLIREYAPVFRAARSRAVPNEWTTFDRDAHAGGYCQAAFGEGADAYAAAQAKGKMLGVRLDGAEFDSGNCPLVAVGGVPHDGTNPPKHLDAEFDMFTTERVGDTIVVRAKLGNVGAAAWLPGCSGRNKLRPSRGGVELVARDDVGKELARAPVASRVDRLGATDELKLRVPALGRVSVRPEARDRCAFGEKRTFDAAKVK